MIKIERIFYAIGQGAFFSETLRLSNSKTIVMVYDCGSDNKLSLTQEITRFGHSKIDFLIISHLHEDHINGISELKAKGIEIETVILPNVSRLDRFIACISSNTLLSLFTDEKKFFGCKNIIKVSHATNNENKETIDVTSLNSNLDINHENSICIHKTEIYEWIFRFYVVPEKYSALSEEHKKIINEFDIEDLKDKGKKKMLLGVYNAIKDGDFNDTTMTLYSGFSKNKFFHENLSYSGIILNGDLNLGEKHHIKSFINHYETVKNLVRDFSIPHHGSKRNMIRPLREFSYKNVYIQCGFLNAHDHPSATIVNMHRSLGIKVKVITEKSKSKIITRPKKIKHIIF